MIPAIVETRAGIVFGAIVTQVMIPIILQVTMVAMIMTIIIAAIILTMSTAKMIRIHHIAMIHTQILMAKAIAEPVVGRNLKIYLRRLIHQEENQTLV